MLVIPDQIDDLEARVEAIEARNRRVELDKDWERSLVRRAAVAGTTYAAAVILLFVIDAARPWLGAAVPTMGYLLSTLALPPLRRIWERRRTRVGGGPTAY